MKRRLIFATNNKHKLTEVRAALAVKGDIEIVSLTEAGLEGEIPETADTLEGNALLKVQWVVDRLKGEVVDGVFADDTGLEVEALGGAPGVYSARYAGEHCSFDDNIDKLLAALEGEKNRRACFRTVICFVTLGPGDFTTQFFEGRVDGQILTERHIFAERNQSGASGKYRGFGYDPVFMPDRFAVSFAEMPLEVKNQISHRGLAIKKLAEYLSKGEMRSETL